MYKGGSMQVTKDEMQSFIKDILDSLHKRLEEFQALRAEVERMVECVKEEQEKLYTDLKEVLAKGKSLRRKDYDNLIEPIIKKEEENRKEIIDTLNVFQKEEEAEPNRLKQLFTEDQSLEIDKLESMIEGIKSRQEERELEIGRLLNGFKLEEELINDSVQHFVSKGASIRIDDFKYMVERVKERLEKTKEETSQWMAMVTQGRRELENQVREMLVNIRAEQERMREHWEKMVSTMKERIQGET